MSYFNIPERYDYEDWLDEVDDGNIKDYCVHCAKPVYANDRVVLDDMDNVYCSEGCFLDYHQSDEDETLEDFDVIETTLYDLAAKEWMTMHYG